MMKKRVKQKTNVNITDTLQTITLIYYECPQSSHSLVVKGVKVAFL